MARFFRPRLGNNISACRSISACCQWWDCFARLCCCVSSCVNLLVHAPNHLTFVVFPTLVVNTPIVRLGPFAYVKKKMYALHHGISVDLY